MGRRISHENPFFVLFSMAFAGGADDRNKLMLRGIIWNILRVSLDSSCISFEEIALFLTVHDVEKCLDSRY